MLRATERGVKCNTKNTIMTKIMMMIKVGLKFQEYLSVLIITPDLLMLGV